MVSFVLTDLSGMILFAKKTKTFVKGRKIKVHITLKKVWNIAICSALLSGKSFAKVSSIKLFQNIKISKKMIDPKRLNNRWMIAVRFPFFEEPIADSNAVEQEPMLVPNITYKIPLPDPPITVPAIAVAKKMEVTAEDD